MRSKDNFYPFITKGLLSAGIGVGTILIGSNLTSINASAASTETTPATIQSIDNDTNDNPAILIADQNNAPTVTPTTDVGTSNPNDPLPTEEAVDKVTPEAPVAPDNNTATSAPTEATPQTADNNQPAATPDNQPNNDQPAQAANQPTDNSQPAQPTNQPTDNNQSAQPAVANNDKDADNSDQKVENNDQSITIPDPNEGKDNSILNQVEQSKFVYFGSDDTGASENDKWKETAQINVSKNGTDWNRIASLPDLGNFRDGSLLKTNNNEFVITALPDAYKTSDFIHYEKLPLKGLYRDGYNNPLAPEIFKTSEGNYNIIWYQDKKTDKPDDFNPTQRGIYIGDVNLDNGDVSNIRQLNVKEINAPTEYDPNITYFNHRYYLFLASNPGDNKDNPNYVPGSSQLYVADNLDDEFVPFNMNLNNSQVDGKNSYYEAPELVVDNDKLILYQDLIDERTPGVFDSGVMTYSTTDVNDLNNWTTPQPVNSQPAGVNMRQGGIVTQPTKPAVNSKLKFGLQLNVKPQILPSDNTVKAATLDEATTNLATKDNSDNQTDNNISDNNISNDINSAQDDTKIDNPATDTSSLPVAEDVNQIKSDPTVDNIIDQTSNTKELNVPDDSPSTEDTITTITNDDNQQIATILDSNLPNNQKDTIEKLVDVVNVPGADTPEVSDTNGVDTTVQSETNLTNDQDNSKKVDQISYLLNTLAAQEDQVTSQNSTAKNTDNVEVAANKETQNKPATNQTNDPKDSLDNLIEITEPKTDNNSTSLDNKVNTMSNDVAQATQPIVADLSKVATSATNNVNTDKITSALVNLATSAKTTKNKLLNSSLVKALTPKLAQLDTEITDKTNDTDNNSSTNNPTSVSDTTNNTNVKSTDTNSQNKTLSTPKSFKATTNAATTNSTNTPQQLSLANTKNNNNKVNTNNQNNSGTNNTSTPTTNNNLAKTNTAAINTNNSAANNTVAQAATTSSAQAASVLPTNADTSTTNISNMNNNSTTSPVNDTNTTMAANNTITDPTTTSDQAISNNENPNNIVSAVNPDNSNTVLPQTGENNEDFILVLLGLGLVSITSWFGLLNPRYQF